MKSDSNTRYRADIDGLRSLAVLPVVAYHAGFTTLASGGFVGVDVFFVISGYLITGIIVREIDVGRYDIRNFYVRRIRRIFPALFAMYLAVTLASLVLLFPSEVANVGKSIVFSILFASNVLFYMSSSYFSGAMEHNPLLHTWSLSVEEQFYVIFPLVAVALKRLAPLARFTSLAGLAALGLLLAAWQVAAGPTAAFYLVQYRAWELLMGALLAVAPFSYPRDRVVPEICGILGIVLIAASVRLLNAASSFPGLTAFPACLGTVLIIYSGKEVSTLTARMLSFSPLRLIGVISYSLYLWHWPIIVFARLFHPFETTGEKLILIAAAFIAASASWRWVEQPFRTGAPYLTTNQTLVLGVVAMLTGCVCVTAAGMIDQRFWSLPRKAESLLSYEMLDTPSYMRAGSCFLTSQYTQFSMYRQRECLEMKPGRPNYLILGDSHAADLWFGLDKTYPGINFLQATASGCKPVLESRGEKRCVDLMQFVFREFISVHRLDGIILSARWTVSDVDAARRTAGILARRVGSVVLVGPVPEYEQSLPRLLAMATTKDVDLQSYMQSFARNMPPSTERAFRASSSEAGVKYYSAIETMQKNCRYFSAGEPVQFDYGHLTEAGSECLARGMNLVANLGAATLATQPPP